MKRRGVWVVLVGALAMQGCGDDDDHGVDHCDHGHCPAGSGGSGGTGGTSGTSGSGGSGGTAGTGGANPGEITINFKGVVGDQAFACGTEYASIGTPAQTATPVDFRFYVQDVHLIKSDASEVPLVLANNDWQHGNVAMIDFEDATGDCDQGDTPTNTVITGTAPDDTYVGVKFTVGVPQDINHADLSTQPSPLNKSGLFWGWNYGHIFLAAVSRSQPVHDMDAGMHHGGDDEDAGDPHGNGDHVTHVGATGCNGDPAGGGDPVTDCTNSNRAQITFAGFDFANDEVVVDFAEIKRGSDVVLGGPCHSFSADTCNVPFANLGIDFATGGPSTTAQTVFRKE